MRVSVYAQFSLKDKPNGYLGLTQASWHFGRNQPASMAELAIGFLRVLFDWHTFLLSAEEANKEKEAIEEWLRRHPFVEVEKEEAP
jgi:hypothetical protein